MLIFYFPCQILKRQKNIKSIFKVDTYHNMVDT